MKQSYTGYKVPKTLTTKTINGYCKKTDSFTLIKRTTLNLKQLEVKFLTSIPKKLDTKNYWYLFYNETIRIWNIPQKCFINVTQEDKNILAQLQSYISNHYGYDRQLKNDTYSELLPAIKEYTQAVYMQNNIKKNRN